MQWNAFLTFNGQCEAAFRFRAERFSGVLGHVVDRFGIPWAINCERQE